MYKIGVWIVEGLLNGIKDGAPAVYNFIKDIAIKIYNGLKDIELPDIDFSGALTFAKGVFDKSVEKLKSGGELLLDGISWVINSVQNYLDENGIDLGNIFAGGGIAGFLLVANKFAKYCRQSYRSNRRNQRYFIQYWRSYR